MPGEYQGQRSLAGYRPWGPKESDMIEQLNTHNTHTHTHTHTHTTQLDSRKLNQVIHATFPTILKYQRATLTKTLRTSKKPQPMVRKTLRLSDSHCGLAHKGVLLEPVRRVAGERAGFQGDPLHGSKILFCQIVCLKHLKTFTSEQKILQWGYLNYLIA